MPFDSNGTYNRVRSWASDAAAGIKIRSDYHDTHDSDIATALSNVITKDGRTQPTANIPMNGNKIINHGSTVASDPPNTVATKEYVDNFKAFATGITITGANYPNGMIHFAATTGTTGISWVNADMSWVGKPAEVGKWRQRLCVTNDTQGAGTELITIDKGGFLGNNSGYYTHNMSHDGTSWRVNKTGVGSVMTFTNGVMTLYSNDTATVQDNQVATLQAFYSLGQDYFIHTATTHSVWQMQKRDPAAAGPGGSGPFTCSLRGMVGNELRWNLELGDAVAESGAAYAGSNFALHAYDNAGANAKIMMHIDRSTNIVNFYGDLQSPQNFKATSANAVVSAVGGGAIYLRPNGSASDYGQVYVHYLGDVHIQTGNLILDANTSAGAYLGLGQQGRNGITGGYVGNWHNWIWTGGELYALVDATNIGMVSTPCDYRTKRNIQPLESTWDKVKKLSPVSYQRRAFGNLFKEDDKTRWGFVAHELQKTLIEDAATFKKDAVDAIQGPNLMAVLAAVTKALQEAMTRIEVLEARAP